MRLTDYINKTDIYFFIGIIVSLGIPQFLFITLRNLEPNYLVIFFINIIIVSIVFYLYFIFLRLKIITDGFSYFKEKLSNYSQSGGKIFTTAIFENYSKGDKIIYTINNELNRNIIFPLTYERFVLLDDPTKEWQWIEQFINLNTIPNFTPVIFRIKSFKRSFIRELYKYLPRFSLSGFYNSKGNLIEVYIGFMATKNNFGVSTNNPYICDHFYKIIEEYKSNAHETIYKKEDIPPKEQPIQRLVDSFEELGIQREYILYIGVFGSNGLLLNNRINNSRKCEWEGDLDLLIVVDNNYRLETIKTEIEQRVYDEVDLENNPSIEWSNLEKKYYVKRTPLHIDIQLHIQGDDYYDKAPLLGSSILDFSLYTLYSENNYTLGNFLKIPLKPYEKKERINLVLSSKEYGLWTAIKRLNDDANYPDTDPNRLLWIFLQNYVWGLTGYRPRIKSEIKEYLKEKYIIQIFPEEKQSYITDFLEQKKELQKDHVIEILNCLYKDLQDAQQYIDELRKED